MARDTGVMTESEPVNLWASTQHALDYLNRADALPRRTEGEGALLEFVPREARRILDIGSGDGRLLSLVRIDRPEAEFVALDFSPEMLGRLRERFAGDARVAVVEHNLDEPLGELGRFDAVVSSFCIHHCTHPRKRALYDEIFRILTPGGVFCNLEHVESPTPALHQEWVKALGPGFEVEDPSNKLLDLGTQLGWLREIGFVDVDCHWKWRELALLAGRKSAP